MKDRCWNRSGSVGFDACRPGRLDRLPVLAGRWLRRSSLPVQETGRTIGLPAASAALPEYRAAGVPPSTQAWVACELVN